MTGNSNITPTFSLVFLLWNTGEPILRTLDSVMQQSFSDYEIVLVDNNSQDDTLQLVRDAYPGNSRIRIVENKRNLGFSRGINRGIHESSGQYICCYNHDTVFPDGYLQVLSEHVTPDAAWTTARQNHRVSSDQTCVRLLSRYRFTIPYAVDSLSGVASVNYIPGDGTIIPREIYHRELDETVFDPSMPMRGEDVDLSLRLANRGVPMRAVLDTYSIHPDKSRMYAPTIRNFLNLTKTIQARIAAHRKNDSSPSAVAHAAASIVTNPLVVYFTAYPQSEEAFVDATSLR
jgi:GT2 family glycosyltransferase